MSEKLLKPGKLFDELNVVVERHLGFRWDSELEAVLHLDNAFGNLRADLAVEKRRCATLERQLAEALAEPTAAEIESAWSTVERFDKGVCVAFIAARRKRIVGDK